jgi:crotonobetainyl-CoA:carnitine CoA-transferase CaiB-like acyl-CoA transferase
MAQRSARRAEVLAVVAKALAADTAEGWEARLRAAGVPAVAVKTLPDALAAADSSLITAGSFRLVGNPIRVAGYQPSYHPAPSLGEHGDHCDTEGTP